MLLRKSDLAIAILAMLSVAGCKGGNLNGTGSASTAAPVTSATAPVTSGTTAPTTSNGPAQPPSTGPLALSTAAFNDVDKSGLPSKGDTVVLTFTKEVKLSGTLDPTKELKLLVA